MSNLELLCNTDDPTISIKVSITDVIVDKSVISDTTKILINCMV